MWVCCSIPKFTFSLFVMFLVCDGENTRSTRYLVRHTLVLAYHMKDVVDFGGAVNIAACDDENLVLAAEWT